MMIASLVTAQAEPIHYLPIATTAIAAAFFVVLIRCYLVRHRGPHLLWWAGGITAGFSDMPLHHNNPFIAGIPS